MALKTYAEIMAKVEAELAVLRSRPVKNKFCATCGRKVDLRKKGAAAISRDFAMLSAVKNNREYHFWCSDDCYKWRL